MSIVMKISDQGNVYTKRPERLDNAGNSLGGIVGVDGDTDQLRTRASQLHHLVYGRCGIGGVGVGHRLHDNRMIAADVHPADIHDDGIAALTMMA